jgi:hypothetical protein
MGIYFYIFLETGLTIGVRWDRSVGLCIWTSISIAIWAASFIITIIRIVVVDDAIVTVNETWDFVVVSVVAQRRSYGID